MAQCIETSARVTASTRWRERCPLPATAHATTAFPLSALARKIVARGLFSKIHLPAADDGAQCSILEPPLAAEEFLKQSPRPQCGKRSNERSRVTIERPPYPERPLSFELKTARIDPRCAVGRTGVDQSHHALIRFARAPTNLGARRSASLGAAESEQTQKTDHRPGLQRGALLSAPLTPCRLFRAFLSVGSASPAAIKYAPATSPGSSCRR